MAETTVSKLEEQCKSSPLLSRKDMRLDQPIFSEGDKSIEVSEVEKEFIFEMRQLNQIGWDYIREKIRIRKVWEDFVAECIKDGMVRL